MTHIDRANGALLGLAVGDALGVPLEFSVRDSLPHLTEMIGGGPFHLQPGEWTDDTAMALCLAKSLIAKPAFDPHDFLTRLTRWRQTGENSANGRCFDIGFQTSAALADFIKDGRLIAKIDAESAGNGSLVRLAPVCIFAKGETSLALHRAAAQSACSHSAPICIAACRYLAEVLCEALNGAGSHALRPRQLPWSGIGPIAAIAQGAWHNKSRAEISSSGFVAHTLEAAIWSVANAQCFEEALILAVNLGHDADSVGAVTGQLAGALWGASSIPERWLSCLTWREDIERLAEQLSAARPSSRGADPLALS